MPIWKRKTLRWLCMASFCNHRACGCRLLIWGNGSMARMLLLRGWPCRTREVALLRIVKSAITLIFVCIRHTLPPSTFAATSSALFVYLLLPSYTCMQAPWGRIRHFNAKRSVSSCLVLRSCVCACRAIVPSDSRLPLPFPRVSSFRDRFFWARSRSAGSLPAFRMQFADRP